MAGKLTAALAWAARGFRVFPIVENTKFPLWEGWTEVASNSPVSIEKWWRDPVSGMALEHNIGVLTNELVVVDLDMKNGRNGVADFMSMGLGFDTLTVRTPTNGFHVYYADAGLDVAISAQRIAVGIDVRGYHGYVLAPGSEINGKAYTIEIEAGVALVPAEILRQCKVVGRSSRVSNVSIELDTAAAIAGATQYLDGAAPAVEGMGGDARTFQVACEVRDRGVSEAAACALLEVWNRRCSPPWDLDELHGKVANAYAYAQNTEGKKHPIHDFGGVVIEPVPEAFVRAPQATGANPFALGNIVASALLRPRPWVLHRMLLRGEVTTLVGSGGMGKSQMALTVAICLALGIDCFGFKNPRPGEPQQSLFYDAEDSAEEMAMRLYAYCIHNNIEPGLVTPHISLTSGRELKLKLATGGSVAHQSEENAQHMSGLINAAKGRALIAIGPLAKLSSVQENDNTGMTFVMEVLETIANKASTAMLVGHHTAKPGFAGSSNYVGNADTARGAKTIIESSRAAFTLAGPTDEDVALYGLHEDSRSRYLRLDDAKMNRTVKGARPVWLEKHSVRLHTGEDVGVFAETDMGRRGQAHREQAGMIWYGHLQSTASMTLAQAVIVLREQDPIHQMLPIATVKQRIETMLSNPIPLPTGHSIRLVRDARQSLLVLA